MVIEVITPGSLGLSPNWYKKVWEKPQVFTSTGTEQTSVVEVTAPFMICEDEEKDSTDNPWGVPYPLVSR